MIEEFPPSLLILCVEEKKLFWCVWLVLKRIWKEKQSVYVEYFIISLLFKHCPFLPKYPFASQYLFPAKYPLPAETGLHRFNSSHPNGIFRLAEKQFHRKTKLFKPNFTWQISPHFLMIFQKKFMCLSLLGRSWPSLVFTQGWDQLSRTKENNCNDKQALTGEYFQICTLCEL